MLELPFYRKEAQQKKSTHGILSDYPVIIRETELREMLLKPPPLPCCQFVRIVRFNVIRLKPGVHTNDFAPIYGRRAKKLGHASLATVFRLDRLTYQPILWEKLESPILRYQPISTALITDACLNTRWHHGAYTSPTKEYTRWLH